MSRICSVTGSRSGLCGTGCSWGRCSGARITSPGWLSWRTPTATSSAPPSTSTPTSPPWSTTGHWPTTTTRTAASPASGGARSSSGTCNTRPGSPSGEESVIRSDMDELLIPSGMRRTDLRSVMTWTTREPGSSVSPSPMCSCPPATTSE